MFFHYKTIKVAKKPNEALAGWVTRRIMAGAGDDAGDGFEQQSDWVSFTVQAKGDCSPIAQQVLY